MPWDSAATRSRIVEAGLKLFYSANIIEVGMDDVAREAGITKKTLYYHYPSKTDLVRACYDERTGRILKKYAEWAAGGATAREKIAAIFDNLNNYTQDAAFKGCAFMRASCEFATKHESPVREIVSRYKHGMEAMISAMLSAELYPSPERLARQVVMLIDGCLAQIMFHGDASYSIEAGRAVDDLLAASHARPN